LHLINGKSLADKLAAPSGRVMRWVQAKASDDALVDDLYLATLCRLPEPSERAAMIQHLQSAGADRAKAAQDALWALLNSREFLFNH
jgi:hypothetical protein